MKTQKKEFSSPSWKTILIILLLIIFAFIALSQLGRAPLNNWDEAYYGENIKQILNRNEWGILYFNGFPFNDKPPLYMWLGALSAMIFGMTEFAVRLPSALAGIAVVVLTVWYTYRKFGLAPAIAAYGSLAISGLYVWRTRDGDLDTLSTLFFVLIYFLIISKHKFKYQLLGVCFALLYLTKLALVAVPIAIFGLTELIYERNKIRGNLRNYAQMAGIMLIIPAVWFIPVWLQLGYDALHVYILRADGGSVNLSLNHFGKDYFLFAYYALQGIFLPLLLWGLFCLVVGIKKKWNFVTFLFSTLIFLQLMFTLRKNNWYLVPMMPFWSIAIGYGVKVAFDYITKKTKYAGWIKAVFVLGLLIFAVRSTQVNIIPLINTFGATREMQTAVKAKELTRKGDEVVRLDHQYPTAIYYTERRLLSSPGDYLGGGGEGRDFFVSRDNVVKRIQQKKVKVVMGKKGEVKQFLQKYSLNPRAIIATNDEEVVAQF